AEGYSVPDTRVGRRSAPNRVEIEGEKENDEVEDFGIDIPLDQPTIEEAEKAGYDPRDRATERATNIVMLGREVRVAGLISNPANYPAELVEALSGASMFSDPSSDPVKKISDMLDACLVRPNQLTIGQVAWSSLRQHPKIVKATNRNSGDAGAAAKEAVAELFEVQKIHVGASRVNTTKPGQTPVIERAWGSIIAGQFIDESADTTGGITFGMTAEHGTKVAGSIKAQMGLHGGELVRSGETIKELIVANHAGFLLSNVA
ncbi:phage capsid protein, partial [Thalassospira sp.]